LIHSNTDLIGPGINKISNMIIQSNIPEPEADLSFTRNKIKVYLYYVYYDMDIRGCDESASVDHR